MSDGVLVVDKPAGMTSHDVVDEVRRRLATRKVGHAGTLDPDATGVLVVGVGRATRLLSFLQSSAKRYSATAVFGTTTTTLDASGEVVSRRPARHLARAAVEEALTAFVGEIEQVPPMVSAVKVGGERLYRKARRGEEVERAARRVTVHALELVDFAPGDEPTATLDITCSAGTFVRTLVADLGEKLGCGAHLAALRRVAAGGFSEADAIPLSEVGPRALCPLADAVRDLPALEVDEHGAQRVAHGRPLDLDMPSGCLMLHSNTQQPLADGTSVAIVSGSRLLAVYERRGRTLVPQRVLAP